jgi:light-regulated signal transduction histidine kinase (bacteriophytochrome)
VADNGIGIAPEYADRIFVIFQRLHGKDAYPGTGIGLAMCRKIIDYHGGAIWLDTEFRTGSRFCFTLPVLPETTEDTKNDDD